MHSIYTSTVDFIYGSGRFGCLGRDIGLLELNKVFVEVSILPPLKNVLQLTDSSCSGTLIGLSQTQRSPWRRTMVTVNGFRVG